MSLTEPSSLCTFWSTSSTLQASSAYKAIKILLVVSELLTKPHRLLLSVHSLLAPAQTPFQQGCVTTAPLTASPPEALQTRALFSFTPKRFSHQLGFIPVPNTTFGEANTMTFFSLFLFLICLLFSTFASHLSHKIPTSDISKHFSGATVYKLAQHSTDTNFLCSLNAEFITRH